VKISTGSSRRAARSAALRGGQPVPVPGPAVCRSSGGPQVGSTAVRSGPTSFAAFARVEPSFDAAPVVRCSRSVTAARRCRHHPVGVNARRRRHKSSFGEPHVHQARHESLLVVVVVPAGHLPPGLDGRHDTLWVEAAERGGDGLACYLTHARADDPSSGLAIHHRDARGDPLPAAKVGLNVDQPSLRRGFRRVDLVIGAERPVGTAVPHLPVTRRELADAAEPALAACGAPVYQAALRPRRRGDTGATVQRST